MPPKSAKKDSKQSTQPATETPSHTNGTTTPVTNDVPGAPSSKPDKAAYDTEQNKLKSEIDAIQTKLSAVKDKIGLASKSGPSKERREALLSELNELKGNQANGKRSRDKIFEQQNAVRASMDKKIKDLNAARGKTQWKSVSDVDHHIKNLDKQVESGSLKLADEKRALQEISQAKRARKNIEAFQKDQEAIDADKQALDEIKKQLDDPEAQAVDARFKAIKKELDELKEEGDKAYAGRSKLFEERDALQAQVNELWTKKRASTGQYREHNDRYWTKVNEDRARRAEHARTQRAAEESEKKKEVALRLREEAEAPAYQAQIEDCQTLIDFLSGKSSSVKLNSAPAEKAEVVGVPKLEIRQVEEKTDDPVAMKKKKGEEEDNYFVAAKRSKGQKKGGKPAPAAAPKEPKEANGSASSNLNLPLATLTALMSLAIPPPAASGDVSRVIEDLKTKKDWFQANQARVTAENIAKAEADIKRLGADNSQTKADVPAVTPSDDLNPPNGGAERPAEPAGTPAVTDIPDTGVSADVVDSKLEAVAES